VIPLGPWAPDIHDLDTGTLKQALNVLPATDRYLPAQALAAITAALGATCVGGYLARKTDGSFAVFAGTATDLYLYDQGTDTWGDVSRLVGGDYGVPSGSYWSFAQFGPNLIACNETDVPQYIDVDVGTNFALLSVSAPQSARTAVIGDFLVMSGLVGFPRRIQWSAINDSTGWTVGTSLSDYNEFPDGGEVVGVSGLDQGHVIQQNAVRTMTFLPSNPAVFQFRRVEGGVGCIAPYSITNVNNRTFYYSLQGFKMLYGDESKSIGLDKMDQWFRDDVNQDYISAMIAVADPRSTRVLWAYKSGSASASTVFDTMLVFDWESGRWTAIRQNLEYFMQSATLGYTLDGLDSLFASLDAMTISLDSSAFTGGIPALGGFTTDHEFGYFDGDTLEATIETCEFHLNPPGRTFVESVVVYGGPSDIGVSVGGRETQAESDTITYAAEDGLEADGAVPTRSDWRYHRVKIRVPAGTSWSKIKGFDITSGPSGGR
jgi:hypothetical protein